MRRRISAGCPQARRRTGGYPAMKPPGEHVDPTTPLDPQTINQPASLSPIPIRSLLDEIQGPIRAEHLPRALDRLEDTLGRILHAMPELEDGGPLREQPGEEMAFLRLAAREACRQSNIRWISKFERSLWGRWIRGKTAGTPIAFDAPSATAKGTTGATAEGTAIRTGFVPTPIERDILVRIYESAPPIHVGDLIRRLVKRILAVACPAQSNEC